MTATLNDADLDALHDRAWMAARIKKSEDWIYRNLHKIPYILIGATPNFTERLAQEFIDANTKRPTLGRTQRSQAAGRKR